jgi:hypothetical protein
LLENCLSTARFFIFTYLGFQQSIFIVLNYHDVVIFTFTLTRQKPSVALYIALSIRIIALTYYFGRVVLSLVPSNKSFEVTYT